MPKVRGSGDIKPTEDGRYLVRVSFTDPETGRRRDVRRYAATEKKAEKLRAAILKDSEENEGRTFTHERKTFADLAAIYRERYAKPAEYVDGRKVAGLRSVRTVLMQLETLVSHFGRLRLRSITPASLEDFRRQRLEAPARTRTGRRSIASVHRELALLRRMLSVAVKLDWLESNPFSRADRLISASDERQRERIISVAEEKTLLAAASGTPARERLRSILIAALDTGARQGELLKLRWRDVNMASGTIEFIAFNTKTAQARTVRMTPRLAREFQRLMKADHPRPEDLVFGITDNVKRSFDSVRRAAGLPDLRFHDLRHCAATRLVQGRLSLAEVGRVLGHTQPRTTYRYVNLSAETIDRAAEILGAFQSEA
jgi:integrase